MTDVVAPAARRPAAPWKAPAHDQFDTSHLVKDLERRTVIGGAVTLSSQAAKFTLRLGSTAILARLLTPADFGLIAMATVVTGFVELFKDAGLSMATVQREKITHAQVSTLFWINVALSLLLGAIVAALAPALAAFYGEPRLTAVTLVLAGTFLFGGLAVQHQALLRRNMQFGRLAVIELIALAAGIATAVLMAGNGFGYWALVGMTAATSATTALLSCAMSGWIPGRPRRTAGIGECLALGLGLSSASFLGYLRETFPRLLIGKLFDPLSLGLYSKAQELLMVPLRQALPPVISVLVPTLCRLQNDPPRFRSVYNQVFCLALLISYPAGVVAVINAREIVALLLGAQWFDAIPLVQAFSLFALSLVPASLGTAILTSLGHAASLARWNFVSLLILVACVAVAAPFGIVAIAFAVSGSSLFIRTPAFFALIGRETCIPAANLLGSTLIFSFCALMGAGAGVLLLHMIPVELVLARLLLGSSSTIVVYLACVAIVPLGRQTLGAVWKLRYGGLNHAA
jgi:O-antigen/teichoic acid export membrane protein